MQRPSLTTILSSAFLLYIAYSMFTLYSLFYPPMCTSSGAQCLRPLWHSTDTPLLQLRLYVSTKPDAVIGTRVASEEIYRSTTVNLSLISDHQIEFDVPASTRRNGSMFIYCFLLPSDYSHPNPYMAQWHLVQSTKMTTFIVPQMPTFQLTAAAAADHVDQQQQLPRTHFYSRLTLLLLDDQLEFDWQHLPSDIAHLIKLDSSTRKYYPIVYLDDMSLRTKDLVQLTVNTTTTNMSLHLQPISIGKLRLLITAHHSLEQLRQLGFGDKDIDEVKSIFADTNFYLLSLTVAIAAIHMLLDVLAFKNDIAFWRERDSRIGLSTRSLLWNTFSQLIIFLYLHEQHSSLLVLIPSGIALVIEVWKIKKAFKLSFSMIAGRPSIRIGSSSTAELLTDDLDSTGMHYLGLVLIPVCISGAIYSFMYIPHRSLYGWAIQSCANGVYAFGFLFMLPQLFINYKMKSVAHLPWRAFMYKAFNTFVDDLFSFIITMPTAHRLACFRDDVVFFVYLYQRYLYPVDKKRSNEFGQSFNDDQSKSKTE